MWTSEIPKKKEIVVEGPIPSQDIVKEVSQNKPDIFRALTWLLPMPDGYEGIKKVPYVQVAKLLWGWIAPNIGYSFRFSSEEKARAYVLFAEEKWFSWFLEIVEFTTEDPVTWVLSWRTIEERLEIN